MSKIAMEAAKEIGRDLNLQYAQSDEIIAAIIDRHYGPVIARLLRHAIDIKECGVAFLPLTCSACKEIEAAIAEQQP